MTPGNVFNIPNFIQEKTPIKLQQAMLRLNASRGKEYQFFDIQYVNGSWYAWYYEDVEQQVRGVGGIK